jgi:3-isopropylmalate/(R)-2-methylmalate dehydratase large subunit
VPATFKIVIKGRLSRGVFAKDIILHIIDNLGAAGATYKAIEFYGAAIEHLDMDSRFTICNMLVEMGAKVGFMPVDKKTLLWLSKRAPKGKKIKPVLADWDAQYERVLEYDISKLKPLVAKPHSVDNVEPAARLKKIKINQAFLGTCTNGRFSDLKVAARLLRSRKVATGVRLIVAPASRAIFLEALKSGIIGVFIKAGAVVVSPGCGPCVGTHNGIPADGEIVISSANRNFKGRMGNPSAFIYLASPATVVASAIEGRIADPRRYL